MRPDDFRIYSPLSFFEKASAPEGQRRRIAGVISTEKLDKQGEIIVQKGLDFSPFLSSGWFNDNHSKRTTDVLGYPTGVVKFQKGERLPDGRIATENGTWAEGYLLNTEQANKVWDLGRALAKAGDQRRLGYSIEGKVVRREGPGGRRVAKAVVRNVAITNCPVGEGTRLEVLAKSLSEAQEHLEDEGFWKAMSMGSASPGTNASAQGPTTGEGAGQIVTPQSLEAPGQTRIVEDDEDDEKQMSKAEALIAIQERFPGCSPEFAERAFSTLITLRQRGLL